MGLDLTALELSTVIRRALTDAINYRRNHVRRSDRIPSDALASMYEAAADAIDKRHIAIVRSGTRRLLSVGGNMMIPAADMPDILEALFLANAVRLSESRLDDADRFRRLARSLGDGR